MVEGGRQPRVAVEGANPEEHGAHHQAERQSHDRGQRSWTGRRRCGPRPPEGVRAGRSASPPTGGRRPARCRQRPATRQASASAGPVTAASSKVAISASVAWAARRTGQRDERARALAEPEPEVHDRRRAAAGRAPPPARVRSSGGRRATTPRPRCAIRAATSAPRTTRRRRAARAYGAPRPAPGSRSWPRGRRRRSAASSADHVVGRGAARAEPSRAPPRTWSSRWRRRCRCRGRPPTPRRSP